MNTKPMIVILLILFVQLLAACGSPVTEIPPTPTLTPDPGKIVQDFWDAVNRKDFDSAMALVADDIECTGTLTERGKELFRIAIEAGNKQEGTKYEINNLVVSGDTVTYDWAAYRNNAVQARGKGESMVVKDGKIVQCFTT